MNTEEKRLLHGLYYGCGQNLDNSIGFHSEEIIWLINTEIPKTAEWRLPNGGFKTMESDSSGDYLTDLSKAKRRASAPLAYLREGGYITCENPDGLFHISVTVKGANIARELNTRLGRLNLLYKEHKDGIFNIILTILISGLTAFATAWATTYMTTPYEKKTEQTATISSKTKNAE